MGHQDATLAAQSGKESRAFETADRLSEKFCDYFESVDEDLKEWHVLKIFIRTTNLFRFFISSTGSHLGVR